MTAIIGLYATLLVAPQQTVTGDFSVVGAGSIQGALSMQTKLLANGQKEVKLRLSAPAGPNPNFKMRLETLYAIDGSQSRIFYEITPLKGGKRRSVTVTFDRAGARAVIDEGGVRDVKQVPLNPEMPRANVSQFWFLRDMPIKNEKVVYYHFNAASLEWKLEETVYLGTTKLEWNKSQRTAHHIRSFFGEAYVDDSGLPYRVVAPEQTQERLP